MCVFQIYEAITASITPVMEGVITYHGRNPGELVGIICDEAITAPITAVIPPSQVITATITAVIPPLGAHVFWIPKNKCFKLDICYTLALCTPK